MYVTDALMLPRPKRGMVGWVEAKQIHNFCFSFAFSVDFELLTNSDVVIFSSSEKNMVLLFFGGSGDFPDQSFSY